MPKRTVTAVLRALVEERALGRCEYCFCRADFSSGPFAVEHVIPEARGGTTTFDGLAFACTGCNGHKYAKTTSLDSETSETYSFFNPRKDAWREHFEWADDKYSIIKGRTPLGRATVAAPHLNRIGAVNQRRSMFEYGAHPLEIDVINEIEGS